MIINKQQLTLGDNHFAYRTCGSGPDILLIHGWVSSGRMWDATMQHLCAHFRLWAIDLMGFGDSRTDDETRILTLDDQMRLVVTFCKAVGIRPQAVIAHSMGGAIAIKLALNYPDLFDNLVLVSPVVTGHLNWNVDQWLLTPVGKTVLTWGQYVWEHISQASPALLFVAPSYLQPDAAQRATEDFKKATWTAAYGSLLSMIEIQLDKHLHKIDKPTLIISGARDLTIPPNDSRIAAKRIPGAQHIEMPSCHHQPPDEDPDSFHCAIAEFLDVHAAQPANAA
jgi:pimeloyl-ACP methyl ester carboxylesterase